MPTSLLAEILGSRKNILFCEGLDKNSLDFKVYSNLYRESYTIMPAGGHVKVIQYVKAFNQLTALHNNTAIGIIDGDLLPDETVKSYRKEKIFALPFNEIEMFLFSEELMFKYLVGVFGKETAKKKVENFKEDFFKVIEKNKVAIAVARIKKIIDNKLENYRIQNAKVLEELKKEYLELNTLVNIDEEYSKILNRIDRDLENRNYRGLLELCNLKKQVSKGLAGKHLDSDYVEKAIFKLGSDEELKTILKAEYLKEIIG